MNESGDRPEGSPQYQVAQQEVGRILEAAVQESSFGVGRLQQVAVDLAKSLADGDELLLQALEPAETHLDLPRHMVNTAIFAIKIGQGAGHAPEELPLVGLAACLHDVGMIIVPRQLLEKQGGLTPEELDVVRRHPEKGFRILQALGDEYLWLANVALHEHEREDGSGYPQGLKEGESSKYANLVGLADTYEALTHPRANRAMRGAFDIMKELITTERTRFPALLLKGLICGLSTFPVGSRVRLNSMETARVVATNPASPLRPVVEIIVGSNGQRVQQPRRVDLSTNALLYVVESNSPVGPA